MRASTHAQSSCLTESDCIQSKRFSSVYCFNCRRIPLFGTWYDLICKLLISASFSLELFHLTVSSSGITQKTHVVDTCRYISGGNKYCAVKYKKFQKNTYLQIKIKIIPIKISTLKTTTEMALTHLSKSV